MANPTSEQGAMDSPLSAWLTLQCQMITGAEAALVVLHEGADTRVARWPGSADTAPALSATVALAPLTGKAD